MKVPMLKSFVKSKIFNIIIAYLNNNSAEPQEHVNNDHHPIILTNNTSRISPSLKDLCAKGPSFVPSLINYD